MFDNSRLRDEWKNIEEDEWLFMAKTSENWIFNLIKRLRCFLVGIRLRSHMRLRAEARGLSDPLSAVL